MPEKRYFLQMTGAFFLGLATLAVAGVLVFALSPYILPFFAAILPFLAGAALFVAAVMIIWAVIYGCIYLGVFMQYLFRPMKVSRESKGYSLGGVRESGRREEGDTKKKKT